MADIILADNRAVGIKPHGALYYDGYVYVIQKDDGYHGAVLHRINANNYDEYRSKVVVGGLRSLAAGLTDIIRIGEHLYISSRQNVLVEIYTPDFKLTHIKLPTNCVWSDCLCNDDTHIYIGHQGYSGRITRVLIVDKTVQSTFLIGDGADFHSICADDDYLYAYDNDNNRLYKIDKITMESVGHVAVGVCSDDIIQTDDYVWIGRESGTAKLLRIRKSDLALTEFTADGLGFCYGVFKIDDIIYYLDKTNDYIWVFSTWLGEFGDPWHVNPPDSYAGINELVFDSDGERLFHATFYDTPGLIAFAFESVTHDEKSHEQIIIVKQGELKPQPSGNLAVAISNSFVDALSVKISYRTISQGHSLFTTILDNITHTYTNAFTAREPVLVKYKNLEIFKGALDSARHFLGQEDKWNLSDYMRLSGRDMSFDLANLKYFRTWPIEQEVIDAIEEALEATGCDITITPGSLGKLNGFTSIDKYLLDMVIEMFEIIGLEGYVDMTKHLKYFELSDLPTLPIIFNKDNVLSSIPVEFDGLDIKNSIEILGDLKLEEPELPDSWTDEGSLRDLPVGEIGPKWEKILGTSLFIGDSGKYNKTIKCSTELFEGLWQAHVRLTFPHTLMIGYQGQYKFMDFWQYAPDDLWPDDDCFWVRLGCADGSYFYTYITFPYLVWPLISANWLHFRLPLGIEETNSPGLPEGMWHPYGNPEWLNITHMDIIGAWSSSHVNQAIILDGLKFVPKRTHYIKEDFVSIGKYHKREFLRVVAAVSNEECKYIAENLCKKMANPVSILQVVTPLDTFIIDEQWKGLVGHEVEVDLPGVAIGIYRIQDIEADIMPYVNLKNGYDAIATVNLIPVDAEFYPDSYAAAARPRLLSLWRRKEDKSI